MTKSAAESPTSTSQPLGLPELGAIVETFEHGRQRVMDVTGRGGERTVYLRPECGGLEWTVRAANWRQVVKP
ncbi:hypothetical protein [Streptodolium elevatio]|uniref:Uncharacterized protein n=1 Tax=Streptodolium elevatio TaxID=3157996 RepID=A0ABV3DBS4_9ACTN